jgi:hypothetical protein
MATDDNVPSCRFVFLLISKVLYFSSDLLWKQGMQSSVTAAEQSSAGHCYIISLWPEGVAGGGGSNLTLYIYIYTTIYIKLHGLSPRANYTDRAKPLVGEVIANFCG